VRRRRCWSIENCGRCRRAGEESACGHDSTLVRISHHGGTENSLLGRQTGTKKKAGKGLRMIDVVTSSDGLRNDIEGSFFVLCGFLRVLRASVVISCEKCRLVGHQSTAKHRIFHGLASVATSHSPF
jgi:hypothetical protein